MKSSLFAVVFLALCVPSFAGEIVRQGKILRVGNSANGGDDFFKTVYGGIGPCASTNIIFPANIAPSKEYHQRAFSIALAAFATGNQLVRVVNFSGDTCTSASYIEIAVPTSGN